MVRITQHVAEVLELDWNWNWNTGTDSLQVLNLVRSVESDETSTAFPVLHKKEPYAWTLQERDVIRDVMYKAKHVKQTQRLFEGSLQAEGSSKLKTHLWQGHILFSFQIKFGGMNITSAHTLHCPTVGLYVDDITHLHHHKCSVLGASDSHHFKHVILTLSSERMLSVWAGGKIYSVIVRAWISKAIGYVSCSFLAEFTD